MKYILTTYLFFFGLISFAQSKNEKYVMAKIESYTKEFNYPILEKIKDAEFSIFNSYYGAWNVYDNPDLLLIYNIKGIINLVQLQHIEDTLNCECNPVKILTLSLSLDSSTAVINRINNLQILRLKHDTKNCACSGYDLTVYQIMTIRNEKIKVLNFSNGSCLKCKHVNFDNIKNIEGLGYFLEEKMHSH